MKKQLTVKEACQVMNVSRNTLIKMLKEDQLEYIRVGNRYRINYMSIPEFIREAYEENKAV